MEELKPCPVCGGEPKLRVYNTYIASFTRVYKYYVECSKQSDHSKQDNPIGFLSKEEAIVAWNRRMSECN